jgi:hypothetical protein
MQAQQREEAFKAQQQQAVLQQQQALMQQAQNAELARRKFFSNPNPTMRDAAELASFIPESQAKAMQPFLDGMSKEQQQGTLKFNTEVLSALQNNPTVAIQLLRKRAEGEKNSGDPEEAALYERLADSAEKDGPAMAFKGLSSIVSALPGAKEMFEAAGKFGAEQRAAELQPSALTEAQSKAQSAAVAAKFAESKAAQDLQKGGWDIAKLQSDIQIAKQNSQIAAMNSATSREGNAIKRQELQLKLGELTQKRDDTLRGKVAEVENSRFNIDNLLNTADRILATPKSVVGSAAGPMSSRIPTMFQSTADFESLIENLDAQAFLSQIPQMKGTGALSENEGKKLAAALQNFSLKQSPEQLLNNVKEAQRLMLKARKTLADRYGVPETVADTPSAPAAAKARGLTTDQILKELGVK